MRKILALTAAAATALAIAACGGASASPVASSTVTELSYFPASSPLVLTIATDPHSAAVRQGLALAHRSPTYSALVTSLLARLAQEHVNYNSDIKPLFGHPIAIGAAQASGLSSSGSQPFLAAWVTSSASALHALIPKLHARAAGTHDGASLYTSANGAAAVDGATLLLANSPTVLTAALDRHANGGGMSSAAYARDLRGLGSGALVTAVGDLTAALSSTRAAPAGKIPWVAAIHGYGVAINATQSGLTLRYHIDTTGRSLSTAQLPIASGSASPQLVGSSPIQLALRDPAQSLNFILAAIQAAKPATYAKLVADEGAVKAATGTSITSLIASMSGNLEVGSDGHTTLVSVGLSAPTTISTALGRLAQLAAVGGSRAIRALGGGFYAFRTGKTSLALGVVGSHLVAGNAPVSQLTAFASAPPSGGPSGGGALTFRVALPQLLSLVLKATPSAAEQKVLSLLGDLTGSLQASTSGLTGTASLALR